ncbi:MAG: class I tRNA ligase family protein [Eubacteriales bacterium]
MTLYTTLKTLTLLTAPFLPFMTEEIYQNLVRTVDKNAPESVISATIPTRTRAESTRIWKRTMARARNRDLYRAARNDGNVKTRQPLKLA